jgi:hypothetical protein
LQPKATAEEVERQQKEAGKDRKKKGASSFGKQKSPCREKFPQRPGKSEGL